MSQKKVKVLIAIFVSISFIMLVIFFISKVISEEKSKYALYSDFSRASIIMQFHSVKGFNDTYMLIRYQQRYNMKKPITKGELLKDFSNYKMIPILNYMNSFPEDEQLFNSFNQIMKFVEVYNMTSVDLTEDIFVTQDDGKYFKYKDGKYVYTVKKNVITKDTFNNLYYEFINTKDVMSHFISLLLQNYNISKSYSWNDLIYQINNNYNNFYALYKNEIIFIIGNDLTNFSKYLFNFVEKPDDKLYNLPSNNSNHQNNKYKISKDLGSEEITLKYYFSKVQRLYNEPTKYYKWLYKLDVESVWKQLADLNYPKIYM